MNVMRWLFQGPTRRQKLGALQDEASALHKENIENIVKSRKSADTLKKVLDKNHITIEIAKALGH